MKTYKLTHSETYWDGTVEIDDANPTAAEVMQQVVEFWMGSETRLNENDGDYTRTFLKMLGQKLVLMQLHLGYNLAGIIEEMADEEGGPMLDGSHGIKLVRCDCPEVNEEDIYIAEESCALDGSLCNG